MINQVTQQSIYLAYLNLDAKKQQWDNQSANSVNLPRQPQRIKFLTLPLRLFKLFFERYNYVVSFFEQY